MTTKRELVLKSFRGEAVDRVPVGFLHHFAEEDEFFKGLNNQGIFEKNVEGHKAFVNELKPDFVKIMSDGSFAYPNPLFDKPITSIKELATIQSIGDEHPWYDQQVELIKEVRKNFVEDIVSIYNIFSPLTSLKWQLASKVAAGDDIIVEFIKEDKSILKHVLNVITKDLATLVKKVITEAQADGTYYSVQSIQSDAVTSDDYIDIVRESDVIVLEAANQVNGQIILHICGYEGATNDVSIFRDYPAHVINWAVGPEEISLKEGQALFGGKTVLGGFGNTKDSLIYQGTKEEIQEETRRLIAENGTQGIIIGADCTIPSDIDSERIDWIRQVLIEG